MAASTVAVGSVLVAGCSNDDPDVSRQERVADRGQEVMPFDLEKTTHRFIPTEGGLIEEVTADDPSDTKQVRLIRQHLKDEADRFAGGDYSDPAQIHGDAMPGLKALSEGAERIKITYRNRPDGATIRFGTSDKPLARALHAWGEAQVSDHGSDAEHGGS